MSEESCKCAEVTKALEADMTVENYVRLRRGNPDVVIDVKMADFLEFLTTTTHLMISSLIVSSLEIGPLGGFVGDVLFAGNAMKLDARRTVAMV